MKKVPPDLLFRTDVAAYFASQYEALLDEHAQMGIRLMREKPVRQAMTARLIERKGVFLVQGVLDLMKPEMYENARKFRTTIIWKFYLELRWAPENRSYTLLKLLSELDTVMQPYRPPA
ncbi:MAG TPA: hypothetical protein VMV50_00320 [Candidatus Paceibacterota bacterium]|nr:hypothetical protein [Candidatus Paceibacterota bacterium]